MLTAKPCPFCGCEDIGVEESSTFRWRNAYCKSCGSKSGEVRCQTLGDGTKEQWEEQAKEDAIFEWNIRKDVGNRP